MRTSESVEIKPRNQLLKRRRPVRKPARFPDDRLTRKMHPTPARDQPIAGGRIEIQEYTLQGLADQRTENFPKPRNQSLRLMLLQNQSQQPTGNHHCMQRNIHRRHPRGDRQYPVHPRRMNRTFRNRNELLVKTTRSPPTEARPNHPESPRPAFHPCPKLRALAISPAPLVTDRANILDPRTPASQLLNDETPLGLATPGRAPPAMPAPRAALDAAPRNHVSPLETELETAISGTANSIIVRIPSLNCCQYWSARPESAVGSSSVSVGIPNSCPA